MQLAARPLGGRDGACPSSEPDLHLELPGLRGLARHAFPSVLGAAITFWLLLNQSVERFVVAKSVVSLSLTLGAIALSARWSRRSMARHGIPVRWRPA